jgi:hypothetical protein
MTDDREFADAEHRFPQWVDTSAAQSSVDQRFLAMVKWCREHCKPEAWACRHFPERRRGVVPIGYMRFYFMDEADAGAFRRQWLVAGIRTVGRQVVLSSPLPRCHSRR